MLKQSSAGFGIIFDMKIHFRCGQAMVEYVLAVCALLIVVLAMGWVVAAARRSAVRTEALVSSDYP